MTSAAAESAGGSAAGRSDAGRSAAGGTDGGVTDYTVWTAAQDTVETGSRHVRRKDRKIVLWRHGQTAWNIEGRFQGSTDVELTDMGVEQARRAARLLAAMRPDAIIASDLVRTVATASELSAVTGLGVIHDDALRETYAGSWQGLTHEVIIERFGDEYTRWKRGEPVRRGGGELETEVADRAAPVVERHLEKLPPGGTLVVVSHGGTIRTTIGRLLGLDPPMWEALGGLSNCCWSVLGEGVRGWRLLEHNAGTLPEPVLGDDV